MTESWVRAFATRHGLAVERRVLTGTEASGFAAFDLTGSPAAVYAAADEWRKEVRSWAGSHWRDFGGCRSDESDPQGRPYLWVESIWFEDGPPVGRSVPTASIGPRVTPSLFDHTTEEK